VVAAAKLQRHVGRKRAGRFLAEGPNLVEAALRRGLVSDVFATEAALDKFGGDSLAETRANIENYLRAVQEREPQMSG